MTQPSSDPISPLTPTTVTITVQSTALIPTSIPVPAPCEPVCESVCGPVCEPEHNYSSNPSQCKCTKQCESICSHIQKVQLHRKDREAITAISEKVQLLTTRLESLNDISADIQSEIRLLKTPSDSTHQESHIAKLIKSVDQISEKIDKQSCTQKAQKLTLDHVLEKLQTINNSLGNLSSQASANESRGSEDIRSVADSLKSISKTLAILRSSLPLIGVFAILFLLLLVILSILNLVLPKSTNSPSPPLTATPTPIPIPVPSPVYSPTPIPIPVPSPVYKPVSTWGVHCSPGYDCLRMRKSPHLSAPVVLFLICNASGIQITGSTVDRDGEIWAPVDYQMPEGRTISGWVVRRFLSS